MADNRRILHPVALTPSEAALAYLLVVNGVIAGTRVRDAASLLAKCEAAMEPEAPVTAAASAAAETPHG